ncbi:MAG: ABC transporter ATP-binding protein [Candidatus Bathyarchaeia archaeon]
MEPVISASQLTKAYNGFVAVNNIAFNIGKRECFGFLGPNGAGKTTTMKMIQGVSPKTSGSLKVNGVEVEDDPRGVKSILGVVPQENNLDPDFTVFKNLTVFARYFDIPKSEAENRARELLRFVQLDDKMDSSIEKLSGGMKRRLILARALINRPEILILDEPTTGLDPQARHLVWEKIRRLKREGVTVVLTTHYMEEASRLCDRLVIMDLGKILVEGSPHKLVKEHIGSEVIETEYKPDVVRCLKGGGEKYQAFGDMVNVFTDKPNRVASRLLRSCRIGKVTIRQASLEDVFLKLTGRALRE